MSGLLKAQDRSAQAGVAALEPAIARRISPEQELTASPSGELSAVPISATPQAADEPANAIPADLVRLEIEATIADLRADLQSAREEADAREEHAFERGVREGRQAIVNDDAERTEMLRVALDNLARVHASRVDEYELLALQIARAALSQLFGDDKRRRELIEAAIQHNLARIQPDLILRILVSEKDFSEADLTALAGRFPSLEFLREPKLASGECETHLQLGQIDFGLSGQWARLSDLFDIMARERPRP